MSTTVHVSLLDTHSLFGDEKVYYYLDQAIDQSKVKVQQLRKKDCKRAGQTLFEAAQNDPMYRYVHDTPDARETCFSKRIERLQQTLSTRIWAIKKIGLTVDQGHSVVCATLPTEEERRMRRGKLQKLVINLYTKLIKLSRFTMSKDQQRRMKDVEEKMNKFAADHLGEAFKTMRSVNALATHPDFQRHGYGGALVDAITSLADAEQRSTYLFSSNPINTEFYNSHGFFTLATLFIGVDDPTWKKAPLPIPLMVRIYGEQ